MSNDLPMIPTPKTMKTTTRVVRFDNALYRRGIELARQERRTFGAFVNNVIDEYCRRHAAQDNRKEETDVSSSAAKAH